MTLPEFERMLIINALTKYTWQRAPAARELGINIRTLTNKITKYRKQGYPIPASPLGGGKLLTKSDEIANQKYQKQLEKYKGEVLGGE